MNRMSTAEIPSIPFRQADILDAPAEAVKLPATCPVSRVRTPTGDRPWMASGYEEVRAVYSDSRFGVSHRDPEHAPRLGAAGLLGGPNGDFATEPQQRMLVRNRLLPYFSPKRMREFQPRVEALAEELLDDIERKGKPADLHGDLSVRLPVAV